MNIQQVISTMFEKDQIRTIEVETFSIDCLKQFIIDEMIKDGCNSEIYEDDSCWSSKDDKIVFWFDEIEIEFSI